MSEWGGFEQIFNDFLGMGQVLGERLYLPLTPEEQIMGVDKEVRFSRRDLCEQCWGKRIQSGYPADTIRCPQCKGKRQVRSMEETANFGKVVTKRPCVRCDGRGEVFQHGCEGCKGLGYVVREAAVNLPLPAGVPLMSEYRVAGEGNFNLEKGSRGDMTFVFIARESQIQEQGNDFVTKIVFDDDTLIWGGTVTVLSSSRGSLKIDIPPKTRPGTKFVLEGKGVRYLETGGTIYKRGNLIVTVENKPHPLVALFKFFQKWT